MFPSIIKVGKVKEKQLTVLLMKSSCSGVPGVKMSWEQKLKATVWKHVVKHGPSVVCSKDTRMKDAQYWLMERPVRLPPAVRGRCQGTKVPAVLRGRDRACGSATAHLQTG